MNIIEKLDIYWYEDEETGDKYRLRPLNGLDAYHVMDHCFVKEGGGVSVAVSAADYMMKNNLLGWDLKDDNGKEIPFTRKSHQVIFAETIRGICHSLIGESELSPDDKKKSPSSTP